MPPRSIVASTVIAVMIAVPSLAGLGGEMAMAPGGVFAKIRALCAEAQKVFSPVAQSNLDRAKKQLIESIDFLEKRLHEDGRNGDAWKAFLKLDELQKQLQAKGAPEASALTAIQERFDSDNDGLSLIWFARVRRALWRYRTIADAVDNPKVKEGYDSLLSELPLRLQQYAEDPTANLAGQIGAVLAWIETIDQAEALILAVQEEYRRPNMFLAASDELVAEGMSRKIDREEPITDCILGMNIRGDGHTMGELTVEMIPNEDEGIIQMFMEGRTVSDNVGYRGVVRVFSDSITSFTARKRFIVDAEEVRAEPATCEAQCDTTIKGVCAASGSRLVEKIARRGVQKNFCQAQWIATQHAEERISSQFDQQAAELLAEANESYAKRFRHPLWQRGLFPNQLRIASAETGLDVAALQAEADQLAALGLPPELPGSPDLALRLHESFINNMAAEAIAGRTINEQQLMTLLKDALGKVPEHFKAEEGEEPWAITFAARQPVVLRFADNGFIIKISVDAFQRGDTDYPGMDITAHYKIVETPEGYKGVRQGEVAILPPGFEVGKNTRLSVRQQTLRELIGRRFDKAFRKEIIPEPLELPGKWTKLGKLPLAHWRTADGWLVSTWKLPERKPAEQKTGDSKE